MQPTILFHCGPIQTLETYREVKLKSCQTPPAVLRHAQARCPLSTSCNWAKKGTAAAAGQDAAYWCTPEWASAPYLQGLDHSVDHPELPSFKHKEV